MKKDILGVKVDDITIDEVVKTVEGWLSKPGKHYVSPKAKGKVLAKRGFYIVTPNPEIVMMARKDEKLKKIINNADLAIPDGAGLKLAGNIVMTTSGIDVMEELVKEASEKGFTVGFLGGRGDVAIKTAECLKKKYPKLKVSFHSEEAGKIPATDILFVAFGAPKQEYWIAANLDKIPVRVAMGVGGAFDYISGKVPRASKWMRSLRLEWLFRLIVQPRRIKRQLALVKYLWLIMVR